MTSLSPYIKGKYHSPYIIGISHSPYIIGISHSPYIIGISLSPYIKGISHSPYIKSISLSPHIIGISISPYTNLFFFHSTCLCDLIFQSSILGLSYLTFVLIKVFKNLNYLDSVVRSNCSANLNSTTVHDLFPCVCFFWLSDKLSPFRVWCLPTYLCVYGFFLSTCLYSVCLCVQLFHSFLLPFCVPVLLFFPVFVRSSLSFFL